MRACALKVGHAPIALACAASGAYGMQHRRRCLQPSLLCEIPGPPLHGAHLPRSDTQRRIYCDTQFPYCDTEFPWRPGFELQLEYTVELHKELGHDGYGQVFLAVHNASGVSRVLKRVQRSDTTAVKALKNELEVSQRFKGCAHVAQIIEGFVDDKYRYVIIDLVDSNIQEMSGCRHEPLIEWTS